MLWDDLEEIVADSVCEHIQLLSAPQLMTFYDDLAISQKSILASYNKPAGGEAYALWYHMMRADNICVALENLHPIHPLSATMRVLDIGSGTGAGVMAVAYWIEHLFASTPHNLRFSCVEPAEPMRRTAKRILDTLQNRFYDSSVSQHRILEWGHSGKIPNIYRCALAPATYSFDLALFCHTFGVQTDRQIAETKRQVVQIVQNYLKPSGVALFLTPHNPPEKVKLMDAIKDGLVKSGMRHYQIDNLPPNVRAIDAGTHDRQHLIIEARNRINQLASDQLHIVPPFSEADPRKDLPYYRFSGRIDIFNKGAAT